MESASLILSMIVAWAVIGLILYLTDVIRMARAWMCLTEPQAAHRVSLTLILIAIEAASAGPLYLIIRTGFFKRTKP